jgi:hypothetical protein
VRAVLGATRIPFAKLAAEVAPFEAHARRATFARLVVPAEPRVVAAVGEPLWRFERLAAMALLEDVTPRRARFAQLVVRVRDRT